VPSYRVIADLGYVCVWIGGRAGELDTLVTVANRPHRPVLPSCDLLWVYRPLACPSMFPSTLPLPFSWGDPGPHLMRGFLSPPRVYSAVDILIGSDVFAGHTVVTNRHTDRPTDRPRYSVCRNRPHSILCVRCGLAVSWWCLSFTLAKRLAGEERLQSDLSRRLGRKTLHP